MPCQCTDTFCCRECDAALCAPRTISRTTTIEKHYGTYADGTPITALANVRTEFEIEDPRKIEDAEEILEQYHGLKVRIESLRVPQRDAARKYLDDHEADCYDVELEIACMMYALAAARHA